MIIAIDYDGTINEAFDLFNKWIETASGFEEHSVCIVTNRRPSDNDDINEFALNHNIPIFFAGESNKDEFMKMRGIDVDVWIDDDPQSIVVRKY